MNHNSKWKCFIFPLHIYPFEVMVFFGEMDDLYKKLSTHGIKEDEINQIRNDPEGHGLGYSAMFTDGQTLIRLPKKPETAKEFSILSHEIFHVSSLVLRKVNIELCEKSEEAFAYLIGYISEQVFEKL